MLSRNASCPVEFVLKNATQVELLGSSGLAVRGEREEKKRKGSVNEY